MITKSTWEFRKDLGDLINKVAYGGEKILITRNGKKMALLVPFKSNEKEVEPDEKE